MKKIFLLSLVTILAVSLVGCVDNNDVEVDNIVVSGDSNLGNNDDVNVENNENDNDSNSESEENQDNVEDNNSENNDPENNEPENNEPEVNEPEVNEPEVSEPENNEPEVNEPEVNEPEVNEPENNEPEIIEPDNNEENLPEEDNSEVEPGEETEEPEEEIVMSDLEIKINTLIEKSEVMIRMPMAMPIEAATAFTFIGLSEDEFNANVANAVSFESMIMPANQSVCLVELKDTADVKAVKQKMIDNCDPNKWICMSAEKCMVVDSGKYVLLVMSTPADCDALQKAFAAEFGSTGEALTK